MLCTASGSAVRLGTGAATSFAMQVVGLPLLRQPLRSPDYWFLAPPIVPAAVGEWAPVPPSAGAADRYRSSGGRDRAAPMCWCARAIAGSAAPQGQSSTNSLCSACCPQRIQLLGAPENGSPTGKSWDPTRQTLRALRYLLKIRDIRDYITR